MSKPNKNKSQKTQKQPNPLESLKDLGLETANQIKHEVGNIPNDVMEQIFGSFQKRQSYSGEISPGEPMEMPDVLSGKQEEIAHLKQQTQLERVLLREEEARIEKKSNELKMQLNALRDEILVLANQTQNLAEETEIAVMQAPAEPGLYHVIFFEKLLEFIKSFRQKIEEAGTWLHAVNKRTAKRNAWGANYKKHGAKYLLSGEHFISRSAG